MESGRIVGSCQVAVVSLAKTSQIDTCRGSSEEATLGRRTSRETDFTSTQSS